MKSPTSGAKRASSGGETVETTRQHNREVDALNADYLHSAFLVDASGQEIRITRDMITESCSRLASEEATKSFWIPAKAN